jgi:hypothetical protein
MGGSWSLNSKVPFGLSDTAPKIAQLLFEGSFAVDKNVPLLALDLSATSSLSLLARIVPVRINARPPFSALFTLWLSMMAAVGLASRCARSRHCS